MKLKQWGIVRLVFCVWMSVCVFASTVNAQASQRVRQYERSNEDRTAEGMAAGEFNRMKQKQSVCEDPAYNDKVRRVGYRIVDVARCDAPCLPPKEQWEFVVFNDCSLNAFALPGGRVGVNTGLLDLTANDDELAAVMGHEVAHVAKQHGQQRMAQNLLVTGLGLGISLLTLNVKSAARNGILAAYGLGSSVGYLLPYSRKHETEADCVGLHYMACAGYNPQYAVTFWKKMEEQNRKHTIEFLSTHPSDGKRIKRLQEWLPEAMLEYQKSVKNNLVGSSAQSNNKQVSVSNQRIISTNQKPSTQNESKLNYTPTQNRTTRSSANAR